jgi:hypothetical protein
MTPVNESKRNYLVKPKDQLHFSFEERSTRQTGVSEVFTQFTEQLLDQYSISRGVLVLVDPASSGLAAVSTWRHGTVRDGLSLNLPAESSLFAKIVEDGRVYTEDFCGTFSGNFFERKLLLDDESRSFAVQPLKVDGETVGLVGYSSDQPTAFAVLEEGVLEEAAKEMAALITKHADRR